MTQEEEQPLAMDKEVQPQPRQRGRSGRVGSGGHGRPRGALPRHEPRPPPVPRPGIVPKPQPVPRPLAIPGSARRLTSADFELATVSERQGVIQLHCGCLLLQIGSSITY